MAAPGHRHRRHVHVSRPRRQRRAEIPHPDGDRAGSRPGGDRQHRDDLLEFHRIDEPYQPGDLVVLCTDALADWALRSEESGSPPTWSAYWDMPQADWEVEIKSLRDDRQIRFDDTTLVLLRIAEETPPVPPPAALPAAESPPPDQDWTHTIEEISEQVGRQLSEGTVWAVKRLKTAGQAARSAIEKYLKQIGSDDRD